MKTTSRIKQAINNADYGRTIPEDDPIILRDQPMSQHMRNNNFGGAHVGEAWYRMSNVRKTYGDGIVSSPQACYADGDLICDLTEETQPQADPENLDKLIALAYYAGRESATKKICDIHNSRIDLMRKKAKKHRYHKLANSIINAGGQDIIYSADYAGDMTSTFGGDNCTI